MTDPNQLDHWLGKEFPFGGFSLRLGDSELSWIFEFMEKNYNSISVIALANIMQNIEVAKDNVCFRKIKIILSS
jgi:hypothetical protein